jgi:nucleotide-binding universal stress UspA family protein
MTTPSTQKENARMKIIFAVDGSEYTKKALAYLVVHESLLGPDVELVALHVQAPMPPRVKKMVGSDAIAQYHKEEADKVLKPVCRFLEKHKLNFRAEWKVGSAAAEIVKAAVQGKARLIVMGSHGHGVLGRALMGSVAQKVLQDSPVPILMVK